MNIWMLDPSAKTVYYDIQLVQALRDTGVAVRLLTSRYVHEAHVPKADQYSDYFFFGALDRYADYLKHHARTRWGTRLGVYGVDLLRLWREFSRARPELIHIQWTLFPRFDGAIFRQFAAHVPLVLTIHNPQIRASALARLDDMACFLPFASRVIVHAEQNRDTLIGRTKIDQARVRVVAHGPLFEDLDEANPSDARRKLGLRRDDPVILFFGIVKPYKGLHDLIAALPLVRNRIRNVQLVIAGPAQESVEPYVQQLGDLGEGDITHLHTRFVPSQEVPVFFAASDVVCLPYREASQSGVLLSAYRFGKPVVVTEAGGLAETVEHDRNGYVVPIKNPPALAEALIRLLSSSSLRDQFGAHSRLLGQTRFGWGQAARLTRSIYEEALSEGDKLRAIQGTNREG